MSKFKVILSSKSGGGGIFVQAIPPPPPTQKSGGGGDTSPHPPPPGFTPVVLKVCKIWLPWLLIYMRIHEIFNVTDGRDKNVGVDFLHVTLCPFLSKELGLAKYFQLQMLVMHINICFYQTPGISNQALAFTRDVKMFASRTDILVKSAIFDNTPAKKMVRSENFCTLKLSEEPNFYNLG